MTELYLIAHKVRGEPAFDIAEKHSCPRCQSYESVTGMWCEAEFPQQSCTQCDGAGERWFIPTSGHQAFPYWSVPLIKAYVLDQDAAYWNCVLKMPPEMPPDLRDHYAVEREVARSLVDVLGLIHKPLAPIKRRF